MANIRNQVMLGRLRFASWAGEIKDTTSSRKIEQDNNAVEGASKAKKVLFPGVAKLEQIKKLQAACRTWYHGITVPWEDGGARAYSAARHFELMTDIGDWMRRHDQLVADFVLEYPTLYAEQQFRLNHMFDPKDYPPPGEIADKFGMFFTVRPISNAEDIRVVEGLTDQEVDRLVTEAKQQEQEQVQAAVQNAYDKLHAVMNAMASKLAIPIGEKGSIFRDSLIENIKDLAGIMPGLNITHDPKLDELMAKAYQLTEYSPDDLKSPGPRAKAQKQAQAVADMVKPPATTVSPPPVAKPALPLPALTSVMDEYSADEEPAELPAPPAFAGIDWDD